jgi:protein gp37
MYRDKKRYGQNPKLITRSKSTFNDPLKWMESKIIFTCSWSDFFIEEADDWRQEAWDIIRKTPQHTYQILTKRPERIIDQLPEDWGDGWNRVWLGVSVENMDYTFRIDQLRETSAKVKFLSLEPLLGPLVDLDLRNIDWVIVGGESGPKARKLEEQWVLEIRQQCQSEGIPFFFKQWGGVNKKRNGRLLEGKVWNEIPDL